MSNALIALEDGTLYPGVGFGAEGATVGEVVFTTSMTGYQETLTDPSYHRQIVVCTVPHVGNVGVNSEDPESARIWVAGFAVRSLSPTVSNWRANQTLSEYLQAQGVIGVSDVETRSLVRHLRTRGALRGVIAHGEAANDPQALIRMAQDWPGMDGLDLAKEVTCRAPYVWEESADRVWYEPPSPPAPLPLVGEGGNAPHIVAYDFGIKHNILRLLTERGCRVTVVPATMPAADVLAMQPDGIFLSNGPGDPAAVTYAIDAIRELVGKVPMFGICLGHQLIGLALGGQTHKLLFGHRGANQPVIDPDTGAVTITTHNHGFAVTDGTLPHEVVISRVNLNDDCIEGLRSSRLGVFSVQYHPEAAPGPHDALGLFDEFMNLIKERQSPQPLPVDMPDLRILALADSGKLPDWIQESFARWRVEQARAAVVAAVEKRLPNNLPIVQIHLERLKAAEGEETIVQNLYILAEVVQVYRVEIGLHSDYLVVIMSQRLNPWGVVEFQSDFANPPPHTLNAARELWRLCRQAEIDPSQLWKKRKSRTLDALNHFYAAHIIADDVVSAG
ncbi:MAG: glutamine-hydrolyzing carbamoyl-phosphate synthase small subunit [Aggregatilineales bacterium]